MSQPFEEWDWPPRRQAPAAVEGRIQSERIVLPRGVPKRPNRTVNRIANGFSGAVFGLFRAVLIVGLSGVLFGSLMLIKLIVNP